MTLSKRKLILFQSLNFSNEIYNQLSAHDWDVYIASDLQQASDLTDKHTFKVGLCLIEEKCKGAHLLGRQAVFDQTSAKARCN